MSSPGLKMTGLVTTAMLLVSVFGCGPQATTTVESEHEQSTASNHPGRQSGSMAALNALLSDQILNKTFVKPVTFLSTLMSAKKKLDDLDAVYIEKIQDSVRGSSLDTAESSALTYARGLSDVEVSISIVPNFPHCAKEAIRSSGEALSAFNGELRRRRDNLRHLTQVAGETTRSLTPPDFISTTPQVGAANGSPALEQALALAREHSALQASGFLRGCEPKY